MMTTQIRVTATVVSHRGAMRPHNEDSVVAGGAVFEGLDDPTPYQLSWILRGRSIVAVADGLGGEAAGEVASTHAVRRLRALSDQILDGNGLAAVLSQISDEIVAAGRDDESCRGMATTVVGMLLAEDATYWFNVGDSPLLKVDGGYVGRIFVDDSPRVPFGEPGADVVTTSLVTQVLGNPPDSPIVPHIGDDVPAPDQRYILCSDGLTTVVDDEQIERILGEHDDDRQAVWTLWATAMNGGGPDNITIVLLRREEIEPTETATQDRR